MQAHCPNIVVVSVLGTRQYRVGLEGNIDIHLPPNPDVNTCPVLYVNQARINSWKAIAAGTKVSGCHPQLREQPVWAIGNKVVLYASGE